MTPEERACRLLGRGGWPTLSRPPDVADIAAEIVAAVRDERAGCLAIAVEVREQEFPACAAASETEVPRAALIRGCAQEIINRIEERAANDR